MSIKILTISLILSLGFVILGWLNLTNRLPVSFVVVISNSMQPTLRSGDIVVVNKHKTPAPSDIILFNYKNRLILHRLISIQNGLYLTKGDANPTIDQARIHPDAIQGVVIAIIPYLGQLIFFNSWFWYIFWGLILIILGLLIFNHDAL